MLCWQTFRHNFLSNNYIEYNNNDDRNKALSVEKYLNKIRPYLRHNKWSPKIDTWEIQLTTVIIFIYSKGDNDERCECLQKVIT